MDISDGYRDLAPGKLANVVTNLEMREPPTMRAEPQAIDAILRRVESPELTWYRTLFHKVGDEYLWFSRLQLDDEALRSIIHDREVEVYALEQNGCEEGLLELDFRVADECEIVYFGLTAKLIGTGAGRWLMNRALERAWSRPIRRLWLHTCTLDHASALAFYERSGFRPFKRQLEIHDDPRLIGLVPREAAPHIPMI